MPGVCAAAVRDRIRWSGPITVADFIEVALYHPSAGYYASARRRSGGAGDYVTSVDVGPLFGELVAIQLAEMWRLLGSPPCFDLVEAGASDGRLAGDVLAWAELHDRAFSGAVRLHLVERSAAARAAQPATLGAHLPKLASSEDVLPGRVAGVIVANELLDALPVHVVEMTASGLREVFVDADGDHLIPIQGDPSSPAIASYLEKAGVALKPGWRAEVNLAALAWVRQAAAALNRGFLLIIDYGHEAVELFSAAHPAGTLRVFTRQTAGAAATEGPRRPEWLEAPGERDITSHVDLTSIRRAAESAGLETLVALDQTYFLVGLLQAGPGPDDLTADLRRRLAFKALTVPGGLGSANKVLVFGKGVGRPALKGGSFRTRLT